MGKYAVDLNSDLGESFGAYTIGMDADVLNFVSSANIACGFHAGDPAVMRKTVALAKERGVSMGAHPGYPDLVGFGRRNMNVSASDMHDYVLYQLGALSAFACAAGTGSFTLSRTAQCITWRRRMLPLRRRYAAR